MSNILTAATPNSKGNSYLLSPVSLSSISRTWPGCSFLVCDHGRDISHERAMMGPSTAYLAGIDTDSIKIGILSSFAGNPVRWILGSWLSAAKLISCYDRSHVTARNCEVILRERVPKKNTYRRFKDAA